MDLSLGHRRSFLKAHTCEGEVRKRAKCRESTSPSQAQVAFRVIIGGLYILLMYSLSFRFSSMCYVYILRCWTRSGPAFLTWTGACSRRTTTRRRRKEEKKKKKDELEGFLGFLGKNPFWQRCLDNTTSGCRRLPLGALDFFPRGPVAASDAREKIPLQNGHFSELVLIVIYEDREKQQNKGVFAGRESDGKSELSRGAKLAFCVVEIEVEVEVDAEVNEHFDEFGRRGGKVALGRAQTQAFSWAQPARTGRR